MRYLVPVPKQFVDESGVPYSGGTVSVYLAGTMSPANIYQNAYDDELADNPAVLDSNGMWKAFMDAGVALDFIVADSEGNTITSYNGITVDGGSGGNGVSKAYVDYNDNLIRESVVNLSRALDDEVDRAGDAEQGLHDDIVEETERATAAEAAAKSTVSQGPGITVTETVDPNDGHKDFEVRNDGLLDMYLTSPRQTLKIVRKSSPTPGTGLYELDVLSDADPSYGRFRQTSAVADANGFISYGSLERVAGNSDNIAVVGGTLRVTKGLYHVTWTVLLECRAAIIDGNYYNPTANLNGREVRLCLDNSFAHNESVELSSDIYVSGTSSIILSISGLPAGISCDTTSLDIHKVAAGGGSGADVVHDQTLVGDGTVVNPLGVSSDITDAVENLQEELDAHKVDANAHSDIRGLISNEAAVRAEADELLNNNKEDRLTEMTDEEVVALVESLN